jgi:hypothetical protein
MLVVVFMLILSPTGCQQYKTVSYKLHKKNGNVTMTVGDVKIEFEGLQDDDPGETLDGGTFFVTSSTSGSGTSSMLEYANDHGVVTFSVSGIYDFKIVDEGTKLIYSDQSYVIGDGPTTITIRKDGTVHVKDLQ